jgi:hypothetical protein
MGARAWDECGGCSQNVHASLFVRVIRCAVTAAGLLLFTRTSKSVTLTNVPMTYLQSFRGSASDS